MLFKASVYLADENDFDWLCIYANSISQAKNIFSAIAKLHGHQKPDVCVYGLTVLED